MVNEIPPHILEKVKLVFQNFDKNNDGVLKGDDEVVQNNQKRREMGQGSIYTIREDMDINAFYNANESIFANDVSSNSYKELYTESQFREADSNSDGKISRKEAKAAKNNENIGKLYKPQKGETLEEYKARVMPEVMNLLSSTVKPEDIRDALKKYHEQQMKVIEDSIDANLDKEIEKLNDAEADFNAQKKQPKYGI